MGLFMFGRHEFVVYGENHIYAYDDIIELITMQFEALYNNLRRAQAPERARASTHSMLWPFEAIFFLFITRRKSLRWCLFVIFTWWHCFIFHNLLFIISLYLPIQFSSLMSLILFHFCICRWFHLALSSRIPFAYCETHIHVYTLLFHFIRNKRVECVLVVCCFIRYIF